ncbi:expansin-like protein [Trichoderma sp. SZMC 28012]
MVSFIATTLTALCLALASSAAPTEADVRAASAHSGSITWYDPGLGACGQVNNDNELICAVSASLYDSQHPCGRKIKVSYQGKSAVVTVVDRCAGCAENDLDLSPAAFRAAIGPLDIGRTTATWDWA